MPSLRHVAVLPVKWPVPAQWGMLEFPRKKVFDKSHKFVPSSRMAMFDPPNRLSELRNRIYWITKRIAQGQFATRERAVILREQGITHVLNVSDSGSIISASEFGFQEVIDCPLVDFQRIPDDLVGRTLDVLHSMLAQSESCVFIHCVAGQNRSPSILWLYFVACGMQPEDARTLITDRSPDAVPGHHKLVDRGLEEFVKLHGALHYLPLKDPGVLEAAC